MCVTMLTCYSSLHDINYMGCKSDQIPYSESDDLQRIRERWPCSQIIKPGAIVKKKCTGRRAWFFYTKVDAYHIDRSLALMMRRLIDVEETLG